MKCEECIFRKKCIKEGLGTEETVDRLIRDNRDMLEKICFAKTLRFEDDDGLLKAFKENLNMFYDVLAVIYTIPMSEYFPSPNDENEDNVLEFWRYQSLKTATLNRCINQANMRTLTLGRASCGFVGEFNSGKSSCINHVILKGDVLPTAAISCTSIPTYIFSSQHEKLIFENMRGNILIQDGNEALKNLAHSSKPNKECPCSFPWNSVLKRIFYFSPAIAFNHSMVFVDLPGYSADVEDNATMQEAIEGCDKIVYFKPIGKGALDVTDLEYLNKIEQKEILIVLSKADTKSSSDCKKTLEEIQRTLDNANISVKDIIFYTTQSNKFSQDKDFSKVLAEHLKILNDFIFDATAVDEDLNFAIAVFKYYSEKYTQYVDVLNEMYGNSESILSEFIGNKALDHSFFETWKRINKDFADSSGSYFEYHIFSQNKFKIMDYLTPNIKRAKDFFESDIYDSNFNNSFQYVMYFSALYYLYKTALYATALGESDSNYNDACMIIGQLQQNYKAVKKNLEVIQNNINLLFGITKAQHSGIVGDVRHAYQKTVKSYQELLDYTKKYEKRWF